MLQPQILRVSEWKCKCVDDEFDFKNKQVLGAGTYGKVYKVSSRADNQKYALKCIKMMNVKEGFPITSLREIKLLTQLDHQNVIKIKQLFAKKKKKKSNGLFIIKTYYQMDLMPNDFFKILRQNSEQKVLFSFNQIRSILFQCFSGLLYIHQNRIIHRDIKSANILINQDGTVKIADFGLAKVIPKTHRVLRTPTVVTLTYRAPEVLLTRGDYDFQLDVWSMGVFALEIALNKPIFRAKDESDQIKQIFQICGTPDEFTWPEILKSEYFIKQKPEQYNRKLITHIRQQRVNFDNDLLDLIDKILVLNPETRLNVDQALRHDFFRKCDMSACFQELHDYVRDFMANAPRIVLDEKKQQNPKNVELEL